MKLFHNAAEQKKKEAKEEIDAYNKTMQKKIDQRLAQEKEILKSDFDAAKNKFKKDLLAQKKEIADERMAEEKRKEQARKHEKRISARDASPYMDAYYIRLEEKPGDRANKTYNVYGILGTLGCYHFPQKDGCYAGSDLTAEQIAETFNAKIHAVDAKSKDKFLVTRIDVPDAERVKWDANFPGFAAKTSRTRVYSVRFDPEDKEEALTAFVSRIQPFKYCQYGEGSWFIESALTAQELYKELAPVIVNKSDYFVVVEAIGIAQGQLPAEAWTWINKRVPKKYDNPII